MYPALGHDLSSRCTPHVRALRPSLFLTRVSGVRKFLDHDRYFGDVSQTDRALHASIVPQALLTSNSEVVD